MSALNEVGAALGWKSKHYSLKILDMIFKIILKREKRGLIWFIFTRRISNGKSRPMCLVEK